MDGEMEEHYVFANGLYIYGYSTEISLDCINFTSAIEASELQVDGYESRATSKGTFAVFRELYGVIRGLSQGEIAEV